MVSKINQWSIINDVFCELLNSWVAHDIIKRPISEITHPASLIHHNMFKTVMH